MGRDAGAGAAPEYLLWRHGLADGTTTTLYAVRHPRPATRTRVVHFPAVARLDEWCVANGVDEAIIGGFFLRDPYRPLGELWIDGERVPGDAIPPPYDARRACVLANGSDVRLMPRAEAPAEPEGDLLQAGPLLVRDGAAIFDAESDREGFTAGASDIPRACTFKIARRPSQVGRSTTTCRSKRPARTSAGSSTSGRFVAAMITTPCAASKPSISASS